LGTDIQVQVQNNHTSNLYISVLVIDSSGDMTILFPLDWDAPEEKALLAPKQTIAVPQPEDKFQFTLEGPPGTLEILVLASVQPLRNALKGLQNIAKSRGIGRGTPAALDEDEPVNVMGNLLGDLNEHSRARIVVRGVQSVDTTQLAAMSTMVEVVQ
jgi:hypothetical protein